MNLKQTFHSIGILCKQHDDDRLEPTLQRLTDVLKQQGCNFILDERCATGLNYTTASLEQMVSKIDLAIVVGGDGTLLHAGRMLAQHDIPVLGVNLGRLGFLVDVLPDDIDLILGQILNGNYHQEQRTLLKASVYSGDQCLGKGDALNDVVLHVRNAVRMIEFTTHIDGSFVNTQRADGMVVATPTGSTAYALSGGGPILHPGLNAVVMVPVCPHTLSHRPVVVSADSDIKISLCEHRNSDARVLFDGQSHIDITPGDHLLIRQKRKKLCLIHPDNYDYFHLLRAKLRWSVQP